MSSQVNISNTSALVGGGEVILVPLNAERKLLTLANNSLVGAVVRFKIGSHFLVATNEVQTINFSGVPTAGAWKLEFNGDVTGSLAFNANAAAVQAALEALTAIGAGNVTVSGNYANGFVVTFIAALAAAPQAALTFDTNTLISNAGNVAAIQNIPSLDSAGTPTMPTAGTFILTDGLGNPTAALAYNISDANLKIALNALADINGEVDTVTRNGSGTWTITFGALTFRAESLIGVGASTLVSNAAQASQQEALYATPAPLQGTYKLSIGNQTTSALAYNASSATIQTALRALSTVGGANLTVTGSNLVSGFAIAYIAAKANTAMPPLQVTDNQLFPDILVEPQLRVPESILTETMVTVQGVGLTSLTPAPYTLTTGIGDAAITPTVTETVAGVAQTLDGIILTAGVPQTMDVAVPLGAVYCVSDTADTPVEVWEG